MEDSAYLQEEILFVVARLQNGDKPSEIANALHKKGLSPIQIVYAFRQATGASLSNLKSLGQWWGSRGVTDLEAFDESAGRAFRARPAP